MMAECAQLDFRAFMAVAASSAEITRPILLWHLSRGLKGRVPPMPTSSGPVTADSNTMGSLPDPPWRRARRFKLTTDSPTVSAAPAESPGHQSRRLHLFGATCADFGIITPRCFDPFPSLAVW
jgi:hypothetical protein